MGRIIINLPDSFSKEDVKSFKAFKKAVEKNGTFFFTCIVKTGIQSGMSGQILKLYEPIKEVESILVNIALDRRELK